MFDHPERPERIMALYFRLIETKLIQKLIKVECKEISDENLLVHTKLLIEDVKNLIYTKKDGEIILLEKGINTSVFTHFTYENKWTPTCA